MKIIGQKIIKTIKFYWEIGFIATVIGFALLGFLFVLRWIDNMTIKVVVHKPR